MPPYSIDPQLTFDSFIVGAGSRLAFAAARRVAEAPGATYNPLFVYSASGLGKTHLLMAIGNQARALHPKLETLYEPLESFIARVTEAMEAGESLDEGLGGNTLLLLDDVQFLAGKVRTQEELLRVWDHVAAAGGQVVLTSDRPPPEIDGLDDRLLSRFSGGLIMDIAAPEYETRVAIVRRKAEQRGQRLDDGVAEAIARTAFGNVRELQGGLNRVIAVQELEGRQVAAAEVNDLLGRASSARAPSEFDSFLADLTETVEDVVAELPEQRQLTESIERWRRDGYGTQRLERVLDSGELDEAESLVRGFERDVERLREIAGEIQALEPGAEELHRLDVLRDPERLGEAESVLADVRARNRPLPAPPPGYDLDDVAAAEGSIAVKAARAVAAEPARRYNPLFVHTKDAEARRALLAGAATRLRSEHDELEVAFIDAHAFADELIAALEHNQLAGWRSRYRRADALFIDGIEALQHTERAQEELFHLFDGLLADGAQLVFGCAVAPSGLSGVQDRLRSRLDAGLVAELEPAPPVEEEAPVATTSLAPDAEAGEPPAATAAAAPATSPNEAAPIRGGRDDFFRSREKVVWLWPYAQDWIIEELS